MNDWIAVVAVLMTLGGLMIGLRFYQRRCSPHPEVVRKLLHIPMGLMTLSFPWLFNSAIPVVALAGLAIAWLLLIRLCPPLRSQFGGILGSVERRSLGEVYFPVAVALLFILSNRQPLLFGIPILILSLADAIAAIIGIRYGQVRYTTVEGFKSAEGSLAFFIAAFFSVHIPLLLVGDTGRTETLLIALILGLLVMLLEAIAWRGLDNLFIPLGSFVLLRSHLGMDIPELLIRLVMTVALVLLVLGWRKRTTLNDSALLGAAFVGYLSLSLGGWLWLVAPLTLLLAYPLFVSWIDPQITLTPQEQKIMRWLPPAAVSSEQPDEQTVDRPRQWQRIHTIHSVLTVCAPGLLWLTLLSLLDRPNFLYPYTLAFAANLAIVGVAGLSPVGYWSRSHLIRSIGYSLKAWLLLFLPLLGLIGLSAGSLNATFVGLAAAGLAGTTLSAIAYYLSQPTLRRLPSDRLAWTCRIVYTTLVSLLALIPWHSA